MAIVVQKFGGTSVADVSRIRNVANRVIKAYDQGNDVVVILSAMAGVTDRLIGLANEASATPNRRELDVLLATGEQTTAALLAMMLKDMGYSAQSLLGHQAEVVTDCEYGNARILEIGTGPYSSPSDRPQYYRGCRISGRRHQRQYHHARTRRFGHLGSGHRRSAECRRLRNLHGRGRHLHRRSQHLPQSQKN